MPHHESKDEQRRGECCHSQVHRADQALLPTLAHSFVACGRVGVPHAPAVKNKLSASLNAGGKWSMQNHFLVNQRQ